MLCGMCHILWGSYVCIAGVMVTVFEMIGRYKKFSDQSQCKQFWSLHVQRAAIKTHDSESRGQEEAATTE